MPQASDPRTESFAFVWREVKTAEDILAYVQTIRNGQEHVYSALDEKRAERMAASERFILRIAEDKRTGAIIAIGVLVPYRGTPIVMQIGAIRATLNDAVVAGAEEMKRVCAEISARDGKHVTSYRISAIMGKCSSTGIIPTLRDLPLSHVQTFNLADDTDTRVEIGV